MADVLSRRPTDFVEDEMERMMRRFFGRPLFSVSGEGFWHPPVDIHLTDKSVLPRRTRCWPVAGPFGSIVGLLE